MFNSEYIVIKINRMENVMTKNNRYFQTNLNAAVSSLKWVHSRPYFGLVGLVTIIAAVIVTHLDIAQILTNPMLLITTGAGFIVGLHILGISLLAFLAQKHRGWKQNQGQPQTYSENIPDHHSHPLKTQGQTIPWASLYDRIVSLVSLGKEKTFRNETIALAQVKPGDTVLDVGCGTGSLALAAKKQVGPTGNVHGTDASPEMIQVARQKVAKAEIDVTFQAGLVENITFPDNQFDVVLSSLMMHHLPDNLKQDGLAEIYRVLKPGGRLLIVDIESSSGGSIFQRLSDLIVQLHGGHTAMENNVSKLAPLMKAAGFISIKTDRMTRQFSYITGKKSISSASLSE